MSIPNSVKGLIYYATSKCIVDNVYGGKEVWLKSNSVKSKLLFRLLSWLKKKRSQTVITTWHGTAFKKMGRDQINNTVFDFACHNAIMCLGDEHTCQILSHLTFNKISCCVVGSPRNEILTNEELNLTHLKEQLDLPKNKKIMLFAPTFRNDGYDVAGKNIFRSGINQINMMNFDLLFKTLSDKFGGEWSMLLRFHYHVEELIDWEKLNKKYPGRFINGNLHDDMAEYLACADVLLTDISSCMFDYMITKKPIFLFFPDVLHYGTIERGFYFPIEELPFSLSTDFSELIDNIDHFDSEKYQREIFALKKRLGIKNPVGSATEIAKIICQQM